MSTKRETARQRAMADGCFCAILVIRGMEGNDSTHEREVRRCFGENSIRAAERRYEKDMAASA